MFLALFACLSYFFSERQAPLGACREPNLAQYHFVILVIRMIILVRHERACLSCDQGSIIQSMCVLNLPVSEYVFRVTSPSRNGKEFGGGILCGMLFCAGLPYTAGEKSNF